MSLFRLASSMEISNWTRQFASSAQKRKWKREAMKKSSKRIPETELTEPIRAHQGDDDHAFLRSFLFLGVMPLLMSSLVIWNRGDLLQDLTGQRFEPIRKEFKSAREEERRKDWRWQWCKSTVMNDQQGCYLLLLVIYITFANSLEYHHLLSAVIKMTTPSRMSLLYSVAPWCFQYISWHEQLVF